MKELILYEELGYEFLAKLKKGMYLEILISNHPIIPIDQLEKLVEFINDIYLRTDDNIDEEYYIHVANELLRTESVEQIIEQGRNNFIEKISYGN